MTEGYLTVVCQASVGYGVVLRVITVPHSRPVCFSGHNVQVQKQTTLSVVVIVVVWASVAVCNLLTPWS
jgi:hypothetical protein